MMNKLIKTTFLTLILTAVSFGQNTANSLLVGPAGPPQGAQSVAVATTGVTGSTQWCYWVVAVYPIGQAVTGPVCVYNANATLTGGNLNTITWIAPPGLTPTGYWVVGANSTSYPGTGTNAVNSSILSSSTFSQTQTSNTLNSFTAVSFPYATGLILIDNVTNKAGVNLVEIRDINNVVLAAFPFGTSTYDTTGAALSQTYSVTGSVTLAQVNAGFTVLAAVTGRTIRVTGFVLQAIGGSFAGCTSVNIDDTTGTPVVDVAIPVASLTSGVVANEATTGSTYTTFPGQLTVNQGLQIVKVGSTCTGPTTLTYRILYTINS